MFNYEKRLEYPVHITRTDPKAAMVIISQYGGPDGEAGAAFRYLSQRYSMEDRKVAGALTDIGTEELGHLEIVATIIHRRRSRHQALINIILTIRLQSGRRLPVGSRSVPASFRVPVTRSQISTKIWLRSRKHV